LIDDRCSGRYSPDDYKNAPTENTRDRFSEQLLLAVIVGNRAKKVTMVLAEGNPVKCPK